MRVAGPPPLFLSALCLPRKARAARGRRLVGRELVTLALETGRASPPSPLPR